MRLPQEIRTDLLEFLGETPVDERHMDALILEARRVHKRAHVEAMAHRRGPEADAPRGWTS